MARSYSALYVDAGYLLAAAATRATGTSLRAGIRVDLASVVRGLIEQTERVSGLSLLRVHWYDAAPAAGPTREQEQVGMLPRVKLRLGRTGLNGVQKGVDLRLGLDVVSHARNGAVDVVVLLSGDDDLTEAVEEAQGLGAQVVILAVPDAQGRASSVARHLLRAADDLVIVDPEMLEAHVSRAQRATEATTGPASPEPAAAVSVAPGSSSPFPSPADLAGRRENRPVQATEGRAVLAYSSHTADPSVVRPEQPGQARVRETANVVCRSVLTAWSATAAPHEVQALRDSRPSIPRELDRTLLVDTSEALHIPDLDDWIRYVLRDAFWDVFEDTLGR